MRATRFFPTLMVMVLVPLAASAVEPRGVRVSFAGPDSTKAMAVAWNTPAETDPSVVEWGTTDGYGRQVAGTVKMMGTPLWAVHEAVMDGLEPDTVYHYRVGGPGNWSADATFRTPPANECVPLTFVAMGDDRSDDGTGPSPRWPGILQEAAGTGARFVLNTGDIVKDGQDLKQWWNFLIASEPMLGSLPTMYTMGNHDDGPGEGDGANYNSLFPMPRNDKTNTEDYYFFTAGDAIFVGLSTMTFKGGTKPFQDQADWLDKVLTEHPRTWKFVFFHHPMHTSYMELFGIDVAHPPDEQDQNAALNPVLDEHDVDIVFVGHNHWYERYRPMRNGNPVPENGTVHVVTGGAGAMTYGLLNAIKLFCPGSPGSEVCAGDHHFVQVTIDKNKLTYTARATAVQFLNTSTDNQKVLDTFTIEKPAKTPDPCAIVTLPDPGPEPIPEEAEPVPDVAEDTAAPDVSVVVPDPGLVPADVRPEVAAQADPGAVSDPGAPATDLGPTTDGKKGGGCAAGPFAGFPWWLLIPGIAVLARRKL